MAGEADYRRWAFESAALDLALRQAGQLARHGARARRTGRCASASPAGAARASGWSTTRRWSSSSTRRRSGAASTWRRLQATGRVACVDLKVYYEGTVVDNPPDATLYRNVVECFPDAVIEDAKPTDETRAILEPAADRLSWDAPVHSLADVLRAARHPRAC